MISLCRPVFSSLFPLRTAPVYFFASIFLALALFSAEATAQGNRVAYVNLPLLIQQLPQIQEIEKRLEREFKKRADEYDRLLASFQRETAVFDRDRLIMTTEKIEEKERELSEETERLRELREGLGVDINKKRKEEKDALQKLMLQKVSVFAKERGYDLVISEGVMFAADKIDITDDLLREFERDSQSSRR